MSTLTLTTLPDSTPLVPSPSPAGSWHELAAQARRIDRRHAVLKAVASRCEPGYRGLDADEAFTLRMRVLRRAGAQRREFLRILDTLLAAGGSDLARHAFQGRWRCV